MTNQGNRVQEKTAAYYNGFLFLLLELILIFVVLGFIASGSPGLIILGILLAVTAVILSLGFIINQPNEGRVLTFFGNYVGVVKKEGFHWVNPFTAKLKISLRVRNFDTNKIKVNDADGNPIQIAAVVVWRVVDSAKALLNVEDFETFISIQSETALRMMASRYPYGTQDDTPSLQSHADEISANLQLELQERLNDAGLEIIEARISHLAYAPEIAQAMLRRQQAQAVVAARQQIVEGAVGMVEMALDRIEANGVPLDEERKAAMANNLLVALVSEGQSTPVINTGSLY